MGDVIHALAALTDAASVVPGLACDWVVEEAFAEIPAWHPAVRRVIPSAIRRWRGHPWRTWRGGEWARFRAEVRREHYDLVLDAQGLVKSALLTRLARGPKAGRDARTTREGLAALFYDRHYHVDLAQDQVERLRDLFAQALGYARPTTLPDFGLEPARFAAPREAPPYAVLVHAASWPSKLWPEAHWQALGRWLRVRGLALKLPWGSAAEREAAERIAAACDAEVLPRLGLGQVGAVLAGARFVIGVDTGVTHLGIALGKRTVTLYGPSVPMLHRVGRGEMVNLTSTAATRIDRDRPNTVALARVQEVVGPWL